MRHALRFPTTATTTSALFAACTASSIICCGERVSNATAGSYSFR